ncbi:hypothetical protein FOG51_03683 [Hanseniaspora uvarum]|nr:hypothetical protein FOG51_03683 [Hanseniaspora uvarum]
MNNSSAINFSVGTSGNNIANSLQNTSNHNVIKLFDEDNKQRKFNTGNVFVRGMQSFRDYDNEIHHNINNELERNSLYRTEEINIINCSAGGLGSGATCLLLDMLTDEFGLQKSIFSNILLFGNQQNVHEHYNQILYLANVIEKMDCITCFDNSFQKHISSDKFDISNEFDMINDSISDFVNNMVIEKSEELLNLESFDNKLKFLIPSVNNIERKLFKKSSQLFDINGSDIIHNRDSVYFANLIATPNIENAYLFNANNLKYCNNSVKYLSLNVTNEKTNTKKQSYLMSNNSDIISVLKNTLRDFERSFKRGAFFQYYEDMFTKDDFIDNAEVVKQTIDSYSLIYGI